MQFMVQIYGATLQQLTSELTDQGSDTDATLGVTDTVDEKIVDIVKKASTFAGAAAEELERKLRQFERQTQLMASTQSIKDAGVTGMKGIM